MERKPPSSSAIADSKARVVGVPKRPYEAIGLPGVLRDSHSSRLADRMVEPRNTGVLTMPPWREGSRPVRTRWVSDS